MKPAAYAAAALLIAAAACTPAARPAAGPAAGAVRVALVDSVPFATEMHEGVLHRVEVRSPARVDTIPWVLTHTLPVVLPGGTVLGFTWEGADLQWAFAWDPGRPLRLTSLPDDADRAFTTPAFSPDGRYLAYVAYGAEGGWAWGIVRRDVTGPVVVRTDSVAVPGTDAAINFARWVDDETFEIYVDVSETAWHRFTGTVSAGVTRTDTAGPPPDLHDR